MSFQEISNMYKRGGHNNVCDMRPLRIYARRKLAGVDMLNYMSVIDLLCLGCVSSLLFLFFLITLPYLIISIYQSAINNLDDIGFKNKIKTN